MKVTFILLLFFTAGGVYGLTVNENRTSTCGSPVLYLHKGDNTSPAREYRLATSVTSNMTAIREHCLSTVADEASYDNFLDIPRLAWYYLGNRLGTFSCEIIKFIDLGSLHWYSLDKIILMPPLNGLFLSPPHPFTSTCGPTVALRVRFRARPTEDSLECDLSFLMENQLSFHVHLADHKSLHKDTADV
jgi:hypothetical protein